MNEKEILLAVVARLLLSDRLWERLGEITEEDLRRVNEGQKKLNKWLEERVNEQTKKCREKDSRSPYLS